MRIHYLDDSGAADTGWSTVSWIAVEVGSWSRGLGVWLDWREEIDRRCGIGKTYELHASRFVTGHGNPSTRSEWNRSKANRLEVAVEGLSVLRSTGCLEIGTVYRHVPTAGRRISRPHREDVYAGALECIEAGLVRRDSHGIVIVDGDGTDPAYRRIHRQLDIRHRRIIEDPWFQGPHASQWLQMADLVAYSTYQHLARRPEGQATWQWYETWLQSLDVLGSPRPV